MEVVSLEIGPCGIAVGTGLFDQAFEAGDPLRRRDGAPRALVVDARRRGGIVVDIEEEAVAWDGEVERHLVPGRPWSHGTLVEAPFWADSEALSGFDGVASGARDGALGSAWWEEMDDAARKELERCDGACGVLCFAEAGGYAGVAASVLAHFSDECTRAPRVAWLAMVPNRDADLGARLARFDATLSLRELVRAADALAPIDATRSLVAAGAAIDLATTPFRTRSCDFPAWTSLVTRDGAVRLLDLAAGASRDKLAPFWGDDFHFSGGVLVDAKSPTHPFACASLGSSARSRAVPFLREAAAVVDPRHTPDARRAAAHFATPLDDLAEIHADLLALADDHEDAV